MASLPRKKIVEVQEEENDCPVEQVRLTVTTSDDPSELCLTVRVWILGVVSCVVLSFVNQFFGYRTNQISISAVCIQIAALPAGRWLARVMPRRDVRVPLLGWSFSLNPGPFTMKEHVLLTIMGGSGTGGVYAINIVTIVRAFYHRGLEWLPALMLAQTTQLLGYGWAGIFRRILVDSPYMWWPGTLISVSLFRALNEEEKRLKGGVSRFQFFLIVTVCSFAYFVVPGFVFPAIGFLSIVCWIWKHSSVAHKIGSGLKGLGVGAIGLDWTVATGFLGSPIAAPPFVLVNVLAGYIVFVYILLPIAYWTDIYRAKTFAFLSSHLFDQSGAEYDYSRVINEKSFTLDVQGYESYSDIHMSIFFAASYGLGFATLTATISHVFLFQGSYMMKLWRQAASNAQEKLLDVHGRMMKSNYKSVPHWWFYLVMVVVTALSVLACEGFGHQLQLTYWGLLLAMGMAFFFTLPIGVIAATTNVVCMPVPGLNIITEMVIGYILPGQPLANVVFKTYGYISMTQALSFLSDFKLGHYMKIPPRSMFFAQLVGTLIANLGYFWTAWYLLGAIPNICDPDKLPDGSPWTCPGDDVFYSASVIWGLVGPHRMFGPKSIYGALNYFFLVGLLAPAAVYLFHRLFPEKKWIHLINFPVIFGATGMMPPAHAVNYNSWFIVGFVVNYWVFKRNKQWWGRYAYVLSAAMDAGTSFAAVLLFFSLNNYDVYSIDWWGGAADDFCPLAKCPSAPGAYLPAGCPQIQ